MYNKIMKRLERTEQGQAQGRVVQLTRAQVRVALEVAAEWDFSRSGAGQWIRDRAEQVWYAIEWGTDSEIETASAELLGAVNPTVAARILAA